MGSIKNLFFTNKVIAVLLVAMTLTGCANLSSQSKIELPAWANQDCYPENDYYYFIGYGEGSNTSTAIRNALITSKGNALTCLFGSAITTRVTIEQDKNSTEFRGESSLELSYDNVNWSGYEQVAGRVHYVNESKDKLYSQYRWSTSAIKNERERISLLPEKSDETNELIKKADIKEDIVQGESAKLVPIKKQENAGKSITNLPQEDKKEILIEAFNNVADDFLTCGIYFAFVYQGLKNRDGSDPLADVYKNSMQEALDVASYSFLAFKEDKETAERALMAKQSIYQEQMREDIGDDFGNISILFNKYRTKCTDNMNNSNFVMQTRLEQSASKRGVSVPPDMFSK